MFFLYSAEDKPAVKKTKLNNGAATSTTASRATDTTLPMSERFAGYSFKVNEVITLGSLKATTVLTMRSTLFFIATQGQTRSCLLRW